LYADVSIGAPHEVWRDAVTHEDSSRLVLEISVKNRNELSEGADDPSDEDRLGKTARHRFPTTRWTVIRRVDSSVADESVRALGWLYRSYWSPLFSTVIRMGLPFHEAEDLTQGFLTKLIQNENWSSADPAKGTLRSYLCTGLRRFVFDELGKRRRRPLDYREELPEAVMDQEVGGAFDKAWAIQLFERAQRRLFMEISSTPDFSVSRILIQKILAGGVGVSNAEIAADHGLTEDAVKMRTLRLKKQWQRVLRDEVGKTVSSPEEIDVELRHLITVFSHG
jgi:DNA-directed RNA polymerase specialized sigma24 family protein